MFLAFSPNIHDMIMAVLAVIMLGVLVGVLIWASKVE